MTTIVVGVDGSDEAQGALRFAVDEAKCRAMTLRLICAWQHPVEGYYPAPEEGLHKPRQQAEATVTKAARIVDQLAPNVECECLALEGEAAAVLLEHCSDAALVVVGRHGHGAVDKLLGSVVDVVRGSVSLRLVRDAHCPVVVVPGAR